MKKRKIPLRTCIGCGGKKDKRELIRIVRSPDEKVFIDSTGKANGRGAYICSEECWNLAAKKKKFSKALRAELPKEEINLLKQDFLKELKVRKES